jgi:DNA-binding response OmpR family regulator
MGYSEKMKILVCEDNLLAMNTLSFILEKEGFKPDTAEDGNKALTLLQETVYDLILMDIHLPFHSGLEVIKYLRSDLKMNTPVLVLTAFSDLQTQRQARELGISGYIVKPFDPSDLMLQICSILKK